MGAQQQVLSSYGGASVPPISFVQQKTGTAADGLDWNIQMDAPFTVGNSIIACVSGITSVGVVRVLGGEDLASGITKTEVGIFDSIWYLMSVGSSGLDTINIQGDASRVSGSIMEVSGLIDVPEAFTSASDTLSDTVATGNVDPTTANNLIVATGAWTADDYSSGPTNAFTRLTPTGGGLAWQEAAYKIRPADDSALGTGWGLTAGVNWAACIGVFRGN